MKPEKLTNRNLRTRIFLATFVVAMFVIMGCSTTEAEATPYDREDFTPVAGPPPFPIIFEGQFTVDGEPGPADQTIYAEFIHGGSLPSTTRDGDFYHVILGPVSTADLEHGVIHFYLGTREGDHVTAEETWDWDPVSQPTNQVLNLTFSRLPNN